MRPHHTPGPWDHVGNEGSSALVQAKDGSIIATVYGKGRIECAANTFLISAGPDMLEALKGLLGFINTLSVPLHTKGEIHKAETAIRKAEGG